MRFSERKELPTKIGCIYTESTLAEILQHLQQEIFSANILEFNLAVFWTGTQSLNCRLSTKILRSLIRAQFAKPQKYDIMKTFKEISDQCERIAKLYLKGFGTRKMYEKVEEIFFNAYNVSMN